MEELKLVVNEVPAQLEGNFEMLEAEAKKLAAEYTAVAITEDSYKDAKVSAKELGKYASEIDERRKAVKKAAEAPIKEFEAKCNALAKVFTDAKQQIESVTSTYDAKVREAKMQKMKSFIDESIIKFGLSPKYSAQVVLKPEYGNVSAALKSSHEDIENQCVALKVKQDKEAKLLAEGNATVEAVNATIEQKISFEMFQREFDQAMSQDTDDNGWFAAQIREKGKKISEAEAEIRRKAEEATLEKARQIAEAEAKKKAEEETARVAAEKAEHEAKEEEIVDTAVLPEPVYDTEATIKVAPGCNVPDDDMIAAATPVQPVSKWIMAISLTGASGDLKAIGSELEDLCRKHNCVYTVDKEHSRKITVA